MPGTRLPFVLWFALPTFLAGGQITTTTLTGSPNPSTSGQSVTLTATVSSTTATGSVEFFDNNGGVDLGPGTSLSLGVSTFTTTTLSTGTHAQMTAQFTTNNASTFQSSASGYYSQVVNASPAISFSVLPSPVEYGRQVTLTASLVPISATGKVTFYDGTTVLGSGAVSATTLGHAALTTILPGSGTRHLRAYYEGDGSNGYGTATAVEVVTAIAGESFGTPAGYTATSSPRAIAMADFQGTGCLDAAVGDANGHLKIMLGGCNGTFSSTFTYNVPGDALVSIATGDFDGDGFPDLAVVDATIGAVKIFLNRGLGDGSFSNTATLSVGSNPSFAAAADFNGDGFADLAVANETDGTVTILLGDGTGGFTEATGSPYTVGTSPVWIAVGYLNGHGVSGAADLAVANSGDGTLTLLFGNGDGTFQAPVSNTSGGTEPVSVAAGYFNSDSYEDLVVVDGSGHTAIVLTANAFGSFGVAGSPYALGATPTAVAVADFNADGFSDVAVSTGSGISVLTGNGDGTLQAAVAYSGGTNVGVAVGDFNADGVPDVATMDTSTLAIRLGMQATSTVVTSSQNPSVAPATVTFTATLSSSLATGTVVFTDNSTSVSSPAKTVSSGAATYTVSLTAGVHYITAVYSGDATYGGSTSPVYTQFVNVTATTLVSSSNPSVYGSSVTFTSSVSGGSGTPTGTVTFFDGNTPLGSGAQTMSAGAASIMVSTLAVGSHSITAVYSGDANNATSTSPAVSHVVDTATPGMVLTSSLNPSGLGQSVTLAATVTPTIATGNVTFTYNNGTTAVATLSGGTATLVTSALALGSQVVGASYPGDSNDNAASATLTQVVKAATTTTLTSSLSTSTYGETVTLTATLNPLSATGTITFKDGVTALASPVTLVSGVAHLPISSLAVGAHSLTAVYGGDASNAASTSTPALSHPVTQIPTTTTLTSSQNPSGFGRSVVLTATVSPIPAGGSVTFYDVSVVLGTVSLNSGVATLAWSGGSLGTYALTAAYTGDTNDNASSASLNQSVVPVPTVTLTSSTSSATYGNGVLLTASLSPTTATGKVTFYDGATVLSTEPVVSGGQATLTTYLLPTGSSSLRAFYLGDAGNAPAWSALVTQNVNSISSNGFEEQAPISTIASPGCMAEGDFNADGTADIAVCDSANSEVSILLGAGSFPTVTPYSVGSEPASIAVADVNGDGIADLVVANAGDNSVSVLLGNSNGTFQTQTTAAVGSNPQFVSIGDFNGDGIADLAVVNATGNTVSVLLGTGGGSFQTQVFYAVGGNPEQAAIGDFNGDGIPDLAVPNNGDSTVSILLGVGDGTFLAQTTYATGSGVDSVALGDFNHDGFTDLAVANAGDSTVSVLLGTGTGAFQARATYATGPLPYSIVTADFNGDGKGDLAVVDHGTGSISALLGNGDGTFQTKLGYVVAASPVVSVVVGDFEGDGRTAMAGSVPGLNGISILAAASLTVTSTALVSSSNPSYAGESVTFTATVTPTPASGTVTFLDNGTPVGPNSGVVPLVSGVAALSLTTLGVGTHPLTAVYSGNSAAATSTSSSVSQVVNGQGSTSTGLVSSLNPSFSPQSVTFTATVTPTTATGTVTFLDNGNPVGPNSGMVTLANGVASVSLTSLGVGTHPITAVYNGSVSETGSTSPAVNQVVNAPASTTTVLTSSLNPAGFGQSLTLTATITPSNATGTVTFTDSLAPTNLGTATVSGGVASVTLSALAAGTHSLTAVYGGDGGDQTSTSSSLTQVVNAAAGVVLTSSISPAAYGSPVVLTATLSPGSATGKVTFYNGESILETVPVTGGHAALTTYLLPAGVLAVRAYYLGDASHGPASSAGLAQTVEVTTASGFRPKVDYAAGADPYFVAVGDFNGDGRPDLAIPDSLGGEVTVLRGAGEGTFPSAATYPVGTNPTSVAIGDFNGDGFADLAVTNFGSADVSVLLGNGTGSFGAEVTYAVPGAPQFVAIGDFNGDGKADLAVANEAGTNVSILLGNGDGTFQPQESYAVGTTPYGIVVGDFNRDGIADLAVVNSQSNNISILLGTGSGTFESQVTYAVGHNPQSIALGDFNGDGISDLVIANGNDSSVSVLLGVGNGTFATEVTYAAGNVPASVAVGDFNGDGVADLAVSNNFGNTVSVLLGTAEGVFQTQTAYPTGTSPRGLAVGDFEGDGRTSLAVVNFAGSSVSIVAAAPVLPVAATTLTSTLNPSAIGQSVTFTATMTPLSATGTVTFLDNGLALGPNSGVVNLSSGVATLTLASLALGTHPITAVYGGDANNLGGASHTLSQVVNPVAGTTTVLSSSLDPSSAGQAVTITATVSPSSASGTVTITDMTDSASLGTLTLSGGTASVTLSTLTAGEHSLSAVYNGDSGDSPSTSPLFTEMVNALADVTLTSSLTPSVYGNAVLVTASILPSSATGKVTFYDGTTVLETEPVVGGHAVLSSDLLPAGLTSLRAYYAGDANNGASFSAALQQSVTAVAANGFTQAVNYASSGAWFLIGGDFNADGNADLASLDYNDGVVNVRLGAGAGLFQTAVSYGVGTEPTSVAVGDVNGDGIPDLVVTNSGNNTVSVLLGSTDGTFLTAVSHAVGGGPQMVAIGDFNGDGKADLAVANSGDNDVSVLLGNGDGTFQIPADYTVGASPVSLVVGDFNGDGNADLAVVNADSDTVSVLLGTGNGAFATQVTNPVGSHPASIATASFRGNGISDLVVANYQDNTVSVLLGNGNGTFANQATYATGQTPQAVTTGDFNGDGNIDIGAANSGNNTVSVFLGRGDGTFATQAAWSVGSDPVSLTAGDFDGDGRTSLATANFGSNNVSVLMAATAVVSSVTLLSATPNPSVYGASVTLTATVTPTAATGTVTFLNGSTPLGAAVNVVGGVATLTTSSFPVGLEYLTAVYSGDANDTGGDSAIWTQTVSQDGTTAALLSSPNPSNYGQTVILTATLSPTAATGTVTFQAGSSTLGSGLVVNGAASLSVSTLSVGTQALTAVYSGDTDDSGATSAVLSQVVRQAANTTVLVSSANPSAYGQSVSLTATVSPSTATGTVTFNDGSSTLGVVALLNGVAIFPTTTLAVGVHSLTAAYSGDVDDGPSTSQVLTQNVGTVVTTTSLVSSANPSVYGQPVTLTATVSPSTATGNVTFLDGATTLFVAGLSGGTAIFADAGLASGLHNLTAVYAGNSSDTSSTGTLALQVVSCGTVAESSLYTDSVGGPQSIAVTSSAESCTWNATTSASWIQLSTGSGTGTGTLTATIQENTTGYERSGTIEVGGQSIAVLQRMTAAIFTDVPASAYYFDPVNLLYAKQITSGCSVEPADYCPSDVIPRWQMAVFMVRAVYGGDDFTASTIPYFADVPVGAPGFRWIQKMYELGITSGCGNGDFCPGSSVPRDDMAVFITRMRYGSTALFDFPATPYFTDVTAESFGWSWIQRMRLDNVTDGCSATLFCPTTLVTRGDMAVFVMLGGYNAGFAAGTPVISAISPGVITHGLTGAFTITGVSTNFVQGVTTLSAMPGITIGAIDVSSPTSLTVQLTAASGATLQPVSVQSITGLPPGNEEAVLPNGLVIQ
jgi:hypothetical protein